MIAAGNITLGSTISDDAAIVSSGSILISDPDGEGLDLTPVFPEEPTSVSRSGTKPLYSVLPRQDEDIPTTTINRTVLPGPGEGLFNLRGSGNIEINQVFTDTGWYDSLDAPNLTEADLCDAQNNIGGNGGSYLLAAANGTLRIGENITLRVRDGGRGGGCTAEGNAHQTAYGGPGGQGGSIFLGGLIIEFGENVILIPGNGGEGGFAVAHPNAGEYQCQDGYYAYTYGGAGGDAGKIGFLVKVPVKVTGMPMVGGVNGGKGGIGLATGGNGVNCTKCSPGGEEGGEGGNAISVGGQGGDGGHEKFNGWPIKPASHKQGDGGDAVAKGGIGGAGASCCAPPFKGGRGGEGGASIATGGLIGGFGISPGLRGHSDHGLPGKGGNGGDGSPPGNGGKGGLFEGDPNSVVTLPDHNGKTGQVCEKIWKAFVATFISHIKHYVGFSEIIAEVLILGADPVPMANATVLVMMTQSDGTSETASAMTNESGTAEIPFTIYEYGQYTLSVIGVEREKMTYDPSLNVASSLIVDVGPAETETRGMGSLITFFDGYNAAMQSKDIAFLFDHLHPAIPDLYGGEVCRAYLESVVESPISVEVVRVTDFGIWNYNRDDQVIPIENTYTLEANITRPDDTVIQQVLHVALRPDASIGWFTDCGDPLP